MKSSRAVFAVSALYVSFAACTPPAEEVGTETAAVETTIASVPSYASGAYLLTIDDSPSIVNAMGDELHFPPLNDPGATGITLTIEPWKPGQVADAEALASSAGQTWLASGVRFQLGDLNTKAVSKIDAITVKQTVAKHEVGEQPDDAPSLTSFTIELPEDAAAEWEAWLAEGGTSSGSVVYLDGAGNEIASLTLARVGISSIAPEKSEANAESIKKVKIELYVEQMVFKPNAGKTLVVGAPS
jgi:hypothetical protein